MNTKTNERGTQQRQRVLALLRQAARTSDYITLRNIADKVGLRSPTTVQHHVRQLEHEGKLVIEDGRITLTTLGRGYPTDEAILWVCWRVLSVDHPRSPLVDVLERRLGLKD